MAITGQSGSVVTALVTACPGVRGLFPRVLAFNMFISSHYINDLSIQVNKLKFALTTHNFFDLERGYSDEILHDHIPVTSTLVPPSSQCRWKEKGSRTLKDQKVIQ